MSVKDTLQKARDLIVAGWCQGTPFMSVNNKYHYCLMGAIDAASGGGFGLHSAKDNAVWKAAWAISAPALDAVREQIQPVYGLRNLIEFNDAPLRTKEEVLAVLDQAIASVPDEAV